MRALFAAAARNSMVITFRGGRIVRCREFYDEATALAAVGLSAKAGG